MPEAEETLNFWVIFGAVLLYVIFLVLAVFFILSTARGDD